MATSYSTLLGLALPVQGELSGTWGDTVNNYITTYLDAAVAGAQTLSTDADITLSKTTGASLNGNSSQYAILNCTGARSVLRTITAPAASKVYVVINQTTGGFGVKLVGAGPTTGITVANGTKVLAVWNGADFVVVAGAAIDLTSQVSGTLPLANGGTGQTTAQSAMNALAAAVTSGQYLRGNGTNVVMSAIQAGDVPTLNQNTTGTASNVTGTVAVANGGTGSTTAAGAPFALKGANSDITSITGLSTALAVNQGGTGVNSLAANYALLGNGTSGLQTVAPGTSGNVLTSNGSTWTSAAAVVGLGGQQVFTGNGTFTIPTGVTKVKITVVGGGGGGGGSPTAAPGSGRSGAGGGAAITFLSSLTPGNTIAVTVGAGGSAGATNGTGGTGGTSQVASGTQTITTVSATGGVGGPISSSIGANPVGGIGSSGNLNIRGGAGTGVGGGSSILGGGSSFGVTTGSAGVAGGAYGGGGSGGATDSSGCTFTPYVGGAGAAGVVMFEW